MKKWLVLFSTILIVSSYWIYFNYKKITDFPESSYSVFEWIVPSPQLPNDVTLLRAHNNLDAVIYEGYEYLVFRDAPFHWPSSKSSLYVIKRKLGDQNWQFSHKFHNGHDLREPRFLAFNGKLFLYFATMSGKFASFSPESTQLIAMSADGRWSQPKQILGDSFIPWRAKVINETAYLSAYRWDGSQIKIGRDPTHVYLYSSTNGYEWNNIYAPEIEQSLASSETDFTLNSSGKLFAVSRNELYDESRWGSKVCTSTNIYDQNWRCISTQNKYDSPLVFNYEDSIYMLARRTLSNGGRYDLNYTFLPNRLQSLVYEFIYLVTPKRCSLWKLDESNLVFNLIKDLPSTGDTCFPAVTVVDNNIYVYNYTSLPNRFREISWLEGQFMKSAIYKSRLFPE